MNFFSELQIIEDSINSYYDMSFSSEEEEYLCNLKIKSQIKELVEKCFKETKLKKLYTIEAILLLAFNTGCVEDEIIAQNILKELNNSKIICEEDIEIFNKFKATNRWY